MKKIIIALEIDGVILNVSQSLVNFLIEQVPPLKEYDVLCLQERYSQENWMKISLSKVLSDFEDAHLYKSIEPMPEIGILKEMLSNPLFDFHFIHYASSSSLIDCQQNIETLFKTKLFPTQFHAISHVEKKELLKMLKPDFYISPQEVKPLSSLNAVLSHIRATASVHYDIQKLIGELQNQLLDDLLQPLDVRQEKQNLTVLNSYTSSEALYHILGGQHVSLTPMAATFEQYGQKVTHWWLKDKNGRIIDPTVQQFVNIGIQPPYEAGKESSFLTKTPSKDAQRIISKMLEQDCHIELKVPKKRI